MNNGNKDIQDSNFVSEKMVAMIFDQVNAVIDKMAGSVSTNTSVITDLINTIGNAPKETLELLKSQEGLAKDILHDLDNIKNVLKTIDSCSHTLESKLDPLDSIKSQIDKLYDKIEKLRDIETSINNIVDSKIAPIMPIKDLPKDIKSLNENMIKNTTNIENLDKKAFKLSVILGVVCSAAVVIGGMMWKILSILQSPEFAKLLDTLHQIHHTLPPGGPGP